MRKEEKNMSTHFEYNTKGTCSTKMIFEIEGDTIESLEVINGCNGNLKGIASLIKGAKVDDIIEKLDGITCGRKMTSCPDQMAQALKQYKAQQ